MLRLSFWSHGFPARTKYSFHMDRGQLAFYSPVSQPREKTGTPGLSRSPSSDQTCREHPPALSRGPHTSLSRPGEEEAEAGRGTWPVS